MAAYTPTYPFWSTMVDLSEALGFNNYTKENSFDFYTSRGVDAKFVSELIEVSTRVNYAQDITAIHGVGGACSMATAGAAQVKGGVSTPTLPSCRSL